jgi:DNA-binding protein
MLTMRVAMATVHLFAVQMTGGIGIAVDPHLFSNGRTPLKAMQEALTAAMATKKLGAAFGLETNDIFLPLPDGMATQLGLPEGTVLHATRMRMDKSGEVILEGTLAGKNLEAEKNFILVGSASDMAATLGQGNDTKGAQLLLVQEKDGFRAVTYLPDGNEQGGIRLLSESTGLNPATVRAALNKSELVGGLGAKPGILERAAETAVEGTKNAIKAIPGAETILNLGTGDKEEKPKTPTEKPAKPPIPESLFEKLAPMFKPGAPSLPGMGPLKVQTDLVETLYANASDILGKWDFTFISASDEEPAADKAPIMVASANVQPVDTPLATTAVKPTASVAPEKVVEPTVSATVKSAAPIETKPLTTTSTAETPEKKGFFARIKETVSSYKEDVKIIVDFAKDEAKALGQVTVKAVGNGKDKAVEVAVMVADKIQDVKTTVESIKVGLLQGVTGNSPARLEFDNRLNDYTLDAERDPTYADYADIRNAAFEAGDYIHDRGLDFMDIFKVLVTVGPGVKAEFGLKWLNGSGLKEKGAYVVLGALVGERFGADGRRFVAEGVGKFEAGVKAGNLQLKPKLEVTKGIGESEVKSKFSWDMDIRTFKPGKILGNDISGNVRVKEDLTLEIGFSFHAGLWGLELKVRPYEAVDFIGGFFGLDPKHDNEERSWIGEHRPYREYLRTTSGEPYLESSKTVLKSDEVPGLFVRFVSLSSTVAQGVGKTTNNVREAGTNILNAGWQWTADVSQNAATNVHTASVLYRDDLKTISVATIGVVKDAGEFAIKKGQDGWSWSKERASTIAEPYSKNVSASFNEMTRADPVTANKLAVGLVASVFSGDIWDRQLSFTFDARGPAVVTINGVLNSFDDASNLNGAVNEMFGVRSSAMIFNQSHTKGLQDAHQVAFHEFFGAIDAPAVQAAIAIRQGIKEKGEVFVVAHSQGSAIFDAALGLLSSSEKARIHYLGLGSEKYISAKQEGLADAKNIRNAGDIVPLLGNTARVSNWLVPTDWSRKIFTNWTNIDRNVPGNRHGFDQFYKQEVKRWAKEIYP